MVAPGFIDMHSHSDMTLFDDGSSPSKIRQGVTTEILGEDSSGGPAKGKRPPGAIEQGWHEVWLDHARRLLRRAREPGNRRQRRQLRRPGHAARMRRRAEALTVPTEASSRR